MTPKKAKPAAGARAGDVKGLPVKRGKSARGGSKRAQHGQKGVKAEGRGQRAGSQKRNAKRKGKAKDRAGKSARITLEAKAPVKVKPWEAAQALPDGQQERFCQLMADGRYSGRSCYAQAYGCENEASARTLAWRLLTKVDITDRIDWLRAESLKNWKCEKEEVMRALHHIVVTPVGYVDEESPLAQEVTRDLIEKGDAAPDVLKVRVKMPGKVEAAKLLAQMQGWEKPKEMNLTVNYEPPNAALERMKGKGIDVVEMLKKAGVMKHD